MKRTNLDPGGLAFPVILLIAAALRVVNIGGLSYWYDEVVSVRLAECPRLRDFPSLLDQIDATRAPLHPILLRVWFAGFGRGEAQARLFSVVCDLLSIVFIGRIAGRIFGKEIALYSIWLAAISPNLVLHARDARMYSLLTLFTCIVWDALFAIREKKTLIRLLTLAVGQTALAYSHPLGLIMIFAQAIAAPLLYRHDRVAIRLWLISELGVCLFVVPWLPRYFDHAPEYVIGPLPFKFLLGTPIGFVGGNSLTLILFGGAIAWGTWRYRKLWKEFFPLYCWYAIPPVVLYSYSKVFTPLFGPERYTLFVAPSFLILLAVGLIQLPRPARWALALLQLVCAGSLLTANVYPPDRHADWRSAAHWIKLNEADSALIVLTDDPKINHEAVVARYYLRDAARIATTHEAPRFDDWKNAPNTLLVAVGLRDGKPIAEDFRPSRNVYRKRDAVLFPGLKITRYIRAIAPVISSEPAASSPVRPSTKGALPQAR